MYDPWWSVEHRITDHIWRRRCTDDVHR